MPAPTTARAAIATSACCQPRGRGNQREEGRQQDLPDVAREIVGAERGARAGTVIGGGHEAGADRMLGTGAEARQNQSRDHAVKRAAQPRERVAAGNQQRAEGEDTHAAEALGQQA